MPTEDYHQRADLIDPNKSRMLSITQELLTWQISLIDKAWRIASKGFVVQDLFVISLIHV